MIPWRVAYSLDDGGPTVPDFSLILYNPDALNRMPDSVRLWGMGHESSHAHNHDPNELHAGQLQREWSKIGSGRTVLMIL